METDDDMSAVAGYRVPRVPRMMEAAPTPPVSPLSKITLGSRVMRWNLGQVGLSRKSNTLSPSSSIVPLERLQRVQATSISVVGESGHHKGEVKHNVDLSFQEP